MTKVYFNTIVLNNSAFNNNKTITSIDCNNINWKNNSARYGFHNCSNLTNVTNISNSVTDMFGAFRQCSNLVDAPTLPNSVTDIDYCFYECDKLKNSPTIPNSVTNMAYTFAYCTNLTAAPTIPNTITDLRYTFRQCNSIATTPEIPPSVRSLDTTFYCCVNLATVSTIHNGPENFYLTFAYTKISNVPTIPNSARSLFGTFSGCNNLSNVDVYIPSQEAYDVASMFSGCRNLTGDIHIRSNQIFSAENMFYGDLRKNVYIPFKYQKQTNVVYYHIKGAYSDTVDLYMLLNNCAKDSYAHVFFDKNLMIDTTFRYGGVYDNGIVQLRYPNNDIVYGRVDTPNNVTITKEVGEYTMTYNSFITAGYDTNGSTYGVYLRDIEASNEYSYNVINNKAVLTKYMGNSKTVVLPNIVE